MAIAVTTVASGGLPVTDVTATHTRLGLHVAEVTKGLAVTKGPGGLPVNFAPVQDWPGIGGGAPVTYVTLDGVATNVTLSNGNLTATRSNTSTAAAGARSLVSSNVGKQYFEVTAGVHNGVNDAVAVVGPATSYATALTGQGGLIAFLGGNIWINSASTGKSIGAVVAGDVVGIAVDWGPGTPTPSLSWVRKNNGSWNGDPTANPATGVGGVAGSGTGLAGNPMLLFGNTGSASGNTMTANFGQTAYANAAPAGFTNWTV